MWHYPLKFRTKKPNNKGMLDSLFTSKMRVQILMRLFLNPQSRAYLRELAHEFGASPGHLRTELRQLSEAGLLTSDREGRQVQYQADRSHPLFPELQSMVRKALGMDRIVDSVVERLGKLELAFLLDDYALGKDTGIIDLGLVGEIDETNLNDLVHKTERYINRRIRTLVMSRPEYERLRPTLASRPQLFLWTFEVQGRATPQDDVERQPPP
jgi:DNA-binding transcriptional ArsR family regulator